jgi:hypothetical protein
MLAERYVKAPQFGTWAMGYSLRSEDEQYEDLTSAVKRLVANLADADLKAQFVGLADLQSRAA